MASFDFKASTKMTEQARRVFKLKKAAPRTEEAPKVFKLKKGPALPPLPLPGKYLTNAEEILEDVRTWYANREEPIPLSELKECLEMIEKEKIPESLPPLPPPILDEMPAHGTREFWAWCMARKKIRLAKEAAIVAAGGTVPPQKAKKPRVKKEKA